MTQIKLSSYNTNWPKIFEQEALRIRHALHNECISIHHVGSTSVPGLDAKPKIDIIAEVKSLSFNHQELTNLNYKFRGGFNLPLRKCYT